MTAIHQGDDWPPFPSPPPPPGPWPKGDQP